MLAYLAQRAGEHNCGRMEWSVLNWNQAAIGFYKNLGAQPVRNWTVYHLAKEEIQNLAKFT